MKMAADAKSVIGADTRIAMVSENKKGSRPVSIDPALLEWADYWYPISWKGVLAGGLITAVGACATIVFLLLQWRTTGIREAQSEWRTASLETQTAQANAALGVARADIAKANAQIAEASARQKEAELKLEQLRQRVSQRHVDREVFLKNLEGKPKAPVEILFVQDDGEAFTLALEIRDLLKLAAWKVEEPRAIIPTDLSARMAAQSIPAAMAAGGQPQGVAVFLRAESQEDITRESENNPLDPNEPIDTPRKALARALLNSLGALSGGMSGEMGRPGVLRVIVGQKPAL
jgi:hypothetical protein